MYHLKVKNTLKNMKVFLRNRETITGLFHWAVLLQIDCTQGNGWYAHQQGACFTLPEI